MYGTDHVHSKRQMRGRGEGGNLSAMRLLRRPRFVWRRRQTRALVAELVPLALGLVRRQHDRERATAQAADATVGAR